MRTRTDTPRPRRLISAVSLTLAAATVVALAQLVFLVGFSYAFFWPGKTGLPSKSRP